MAGLVKSIIVTFLSGIFFSFLLHILNQKIYAIFDSIQRDLNKLCNINRRILNFICYLSAILISVLFRIILNFNDVIQAFILGFLLAIIDTCFRNNIIENSINNKN